MGIDEKYFIINKMYAGDYLDVGQNIGHEIINLFCADDGNNYIYINPSGIIDKKYDNKNIEAVFLTKQCGKGCQKILAIAEIEDQLLKQSKGTIKEQAEELKIRYGGHFLENIFENNSYYAEVKRGSRRGKKDRNRIKKDDIANKVTFLTKKNGFYFPTEGTHVVLADANADKETLCSLKEKGYSIYQLGDYKFGYQSPKFYFSNYDSGKKKDAYRKLAKVMADAKNENKFINKMPDTIDAPKNRKKRELYRQEAATYIEAMGQLNRENIFSNLLCFFLDFDRNLLQTLCKKIFGVDIEKTASIKREFHHVDIWIQDGNNIVIIENKIHSGLNGKDGKQLKNYMKEAEKEAKKNNIDKSNIKYFVIAPNYYTKIPKEKLKVKNNEYKMVRYKEIYNIFNNHQLEKDIYKDQKYLDEINSYYKDFKRALLAHSKDSNTTKSEAMERRFYSRLDQLDKEKEHSY